ncbi:Fur family transcriptional regulator [Anaerotalea alkaliphila]|uniref:Transcriptional repressor n=1 Tax=Anaerotalea alkaliphila TaxID=2662126 RepID=A0A7X5KL47_9FIRM|nr:transcriptional repressor [Anaerotalea alkaliphila]NDL66451.1 transcriptional repressor [Anaerotalea alkaliphila]
MYGDSKELFDRLGIRSTRQRKRVYALMLEQKEPVTAERIYRLLHGKEGDGTVNLSTVYRVLELFVNKEIVLKSMIAKENKAVYEINDMSHKHHVTCLSCRKVFFVEGCPLRDFEEKLLEQLDFQVAGHQLEVYGYCAECRKSQNGSGQDKNVLS